MEDLTQVEMYCIQYLSPSDAVDDEDDVNVIVQLETYDGAYIYTSWPACPFDIDDVSCINKGVLKCMIRYRAISEPCYRYHLYIYR